MKPRDSLARAVPATIAITVALAGSLGTAGGAPVQDQASSNSSGRASWKIRDLGALNGGASEAAAINERGQVVGQATTRGYGSPQHAFLWEKGKLTDLGTVGRDLGGDMPNLSKAVAINDRGQVLGNGSVNQNSPVSYAFLWQAGRKTILTESGATSGGAFRYSVARALNERGQVVGWVGSDVGFGEGTAFLWDSGRMTELGRLGNRPYSSAVDVNERGQVVGESYVLDDDGGQARTRAFLWQRGRVVDLGVPRGTTESWAVAVNEPGEVLGAGFTEDGPVGFLWRKGELTDLGRLEPIALNDRAHVIANVAALFSDGGRAIVWRDGRRIDLGTLGGRYTTAKAINNHGQIVGQSQTKSGTWHAFLWQNGKMTDLGTLGGKTSVATAINEKGWIVGSSETRVGRTRGVLWTRR